MRAGRQVVDDVNDGEPERYKFDWSLSLRYDDTHVLYIINFIDQESRYIQHPYGRISVCSCQYCFVFGTKTMIMITSKSLFTKYHHCICITMEVLVVVAVWLGDILLWDQHRRCDGSSIVVAVLETTQTCDLVHNDEDEDDYMYVTLL